MRWCVSRGSTQNELQRYLVDSTISHMAVSCRRSTLAQPAVLMVHDTGSWVWFVVYVVIKADGLRELDSSLKACGTRSISRLLLTLALLFNICRVARLVELWPWDASGR